MKNFKLPECNKEIIINEDISGDTLLQLSKLTAEPFSKLLSGKEKTKAVCRTKFTNFLEKNKDKF